jgi:hypothetical protein
LHGRLRAAVSGTSASAFEPASILAPIVSQEVWAAGVTYFRSRTARIEESKDAEAVLSTTESTRLTVQSFSSKQPGAESSVLAPPCESDPTRGGPCQSLN